LKIQNKIHW